MGFTLAARIEGMALATSMTSARSTEAPTRVAGSRGFNPNRSAPAAVATRAKAGR
jgi:hypothetical protein